MKIWKILVGAIFIFLTSQCHAMESSDDESGCCCYPRLRTQRPVLKLQDQISKNDTQQESDDEISDTSSHDGIWTTIVSETVNFDGIWNDIKKSRGPAFNKDFYHDYFLESAQELYAIDRRIFSVAGGAKNWLNMTITPVLIDSLGLGTGTIQEDFPWLKEQDFTLQVIGYLGWLKDTELEAKCAKRALKDLKDILKGRDTVSEDARPEQVQIMGAAMMKIADWTAATMPFSHAQEILNHFFSEYEVSASTGDTRRHRFILAFNSSIAYMNPKDTLFDLNSFQTLRDLVLDPELQEYIPIDFYSSLKGKYLVR